MKNLDTLKALKDMQTANIFAALKENNEEKLKEAMDAWMQTGMDEIKAVHEEWEASHDEAVLESRGIKMLTAEETKYWDSFIEKARNAAQGVYEGLMEQLPTTEYKSILEELKYESPLLNAINFEFAGPVIKWLVDDSAEQRATWHALNTPITKELFGGPFKEMSMILCKLTAFIYISNDMLNLGPRWVRPYALQLLKNAIKYGLEYSIISGTGVDEPIGVIRDFNAPFDKVKGYPVKEKIKVTELSIDTYAGLLAGFAVKDSGKARDDISSILFVVNPIDYYTKVWPSTTFMTPEGRYVSDVFPYPTTVVPSIAVSAGDAVMGIAKDYYFALGSAKGGQIEDDDGKSLFLEDMTTFKTKLYGNGMAMNVSAWAYLDITELTRVIPLVATTDAPLDATLTKVTLSDVDLNTTFDRLRANYQGTAEAATSTITATAKDGDATIAITCNGTSVTNGQAATLTNNKVNKIVVKVTNGNAEKIYKFDITRGTPT